jgi:hypothetical protein
MGRADMFAGLVLGMTCAEGKRFLRIFAIELCAGFINELGGSQSCGSWLASDGGVSASPLLE